MTPIRWVSFLIAMSILLASGVLYHSLAADSEQLDLAAARVPQVPKTVGVWHGFDETPDEASFVQTGAKSYWMRSYVNQETKASVLVILMCGRAGRMSVHTPEVCYHGAGYELQGAAAAFTLESESPHQWWNARFDKRVGRPGQLRLYWSWNANGDWQASSAPRWQYRGSPYLYKLYVSHEIIAPTATDPVPDFLRAFVPELNTTLFPG